MARPYEPPAAGWQTWVNRAGDQSSACSGAGAALESLAYNRFQETEADHIGVFLMTFAGYDPEASLAFWERMKDEFSGSIRLPEILSDHPADARRLAQLRGWVPLAEGARRAYDNGQIESAGALLNPPLVVQRGLSFREKASFHGPLCLAQAGRRPCPQTEEGLT